MEHHREREGSDPARNTSIRLAPMDDVALRYIRRVMGLSTDASAIRYALRRVHRELRRETGGEA